jgi:hypothetical protein
LGVFLFGTKAGNRWIQWLLQEPPCAALRAESSMKQRTKLLRHWHHVVPDDFFLPQFMENVDKSRA